MRREEGRPTIAVRWREESRLAIIAAHRGAADRRMRRDLRQPAEKSKTIPSEIQNHVGGGRKIKSVCESQKILCKDDYSPYTLFSFWRLSYILNEVMNTMNLDYSEIGRRIARRRMALGLRQIQVCEIAGINDKYLSAIERAVSIPSLEVLMRLAIALDTTPDEFLVGTVQSDNEDWKYVAEQLRGMDAKQLSLAKSLLSWLRDQSL